MNHCYQPLFQKHSGEKWWHCSHCRLWSGGQIQQRHWVSWHLPKHKSGNQTLHGTRDSQQLLEHQLLWELQGCWHVLPWPGALGGGQADNELWQQGCGRLSASLLWSVTKWSFTPWSLPSCLHQTDPTTQTSTMAILVRHPNADTFIYLQKCKIQISSNLHSSFQILQHSSQIKSIYPNLMKHKWF